MYRSPDDVEKIIRDNYAQGIRRFFITDDNFARNHDWEPLFDRLIALRYGDCPKIGFTIQVDTLCHKIPNFIEKAAQAGVRRVFIGLENISPDNLIAAKKRQNKITDYRDMLQKWREHGAITCAGYIIGFPNDSKETILRDIDIIKRELPLDILELFFLTPLPGSEDHKILWQKGTWMDPDMNRYDLHHRVTRHGKMTDAEWEDTYRAAWEAFYTVEHIRTVLRRAAASPLGRPKTALSTLLWFKLVSRRCSPTRRRGVAAQISTRPPSRPATGKSVSVLPALPQETVGKLWRYWGVYRQCKAILRDTLRAPDRWTYADIAIAKPAADDFEILDLYHATTGGEAAVARKRRHDAIRTGVAIPHVASGGAVA